MAEKFARHPNLTAWAVLALGMLLILAWAARGSELDPRQWAALGGATVALAGACAWIISWEAGPDEGDPVGNEEDTGSSDAIDPERSIASEGGAEPGAQPGVGADSPEEASAAG